jgi:hypothetical protein
MMDSATDFEIESERFKLGYISGLKLALSLVDRHGATAGTIKAALLDVIRIHSEGQ